MGIHRTRFACPVCLTHQETQRGMCVECGNLIGCTAVGHDESRPFYGCQDNGVLTAEILKLSRERNNLLSALSLIAKHEPDPLIAYDFRASQLIRELKQVALNVLKDYDDDIS